jgi:uncharacterized protein YciI
MTCACRRADFLTLTRLVLCGVAGLIAAGPSAVFAEDPPATEAAAKAPWHWVFLVTGRSSSEFPRESLEKMQQAHLANFGRLAEQDLLIAAGPMADPDKKLRGICVVRAKSADEMASRFAEDPFVREGLLRVESQPVTFVHGALQLVLEDVGLEEHQLLILESRDPQFDAAAILQRMEDRHPSQLSVSLEASEGVQRRGLAVYPKVDAELIKTEWQKDDAIATGSGSIRVMPLYLAKGAITSR